VNNITLPSFSPTPSLTEVVNRFTERHPYYMSSLDLRQGYLQIPVHPDDKSKTTFITHQGQFNYKYMPFGMVGCSDTHRRLLTNVFQGLSHDRTVIYLDGIILWTTKQEGFSSHLSLLQTGFDRIKQANLKLYPSGCWICRPSIELFGHRVDRDGIHVSDSNVKLIREIPVPTSQKSLRNLLPAYAYYRRFIQNFAGIVAPLRTLLKSSVYVDTSMPAIV